MTQTLKGGTAMILQPLSGVLANGLKYMVYCKAISIKGK